MHVRMHQIGIIGLMTLVIGVFVRLEETNSVTPTGGVDMPIAKLIVVMIPK